MLPPDRVRYLAEIAETVRGYHGRDAGVGGARAAPAAPADGAASVVGEAVVDAAAGRGGARAAGCGRGAARRVAAAVEAYSGDEQVVTVRDRELRTPLTRETLSGSRIPRVALPRYTDDGELLRFLRGENLPGRFPFTAGVFPFKREGEDPARMFAGEGDPFRTNRRFHLLAERRAGDPAVDGVRLRDALRPRPRHRARTSTARSARRASRSRRSTT